MKTIIKEITKILPIFLFLALIVTDFFVGVDDRYWIIAIAYSLAVIAQGD